ncbi:Rxt3-domain-containing protein [Thozetella sp. PMI_491]|nr:Rxt3-domain-containing protein [Thozetella sp. PMI_491]
MDPRQQPPPQLPFSRNAASPYGRSPFPPATTASQQPSYPPASHPPAANPSYPELHARKISDPPPYYPSRQYPPDAGPHPPSGHSRHQSASSITPGPHLNRGMPPPNSPPQQGQGSNSHELRNSYGLPPPRPPPYNPAPPPVSSGPPFAQSVHASPRMHAASTEYAPFRRPQTPERHRLYDGRDSRASAAGSPQGGFSTTPELQRYGTPQAYPQRGPPLTAAEQAREHSRLSGGPVPPRPSSQPKAYSSGPPPRHPDVGRPPQGDMYGRREEPRPSEEYNPERPIRVSQYDDQRYIPERDRERLERDRLERDRLERDRLERDRIERERQDREIEFRERERRERAMSGGEPGRPYPMHQPEYARQAEQREIEQRQMEQRAPPYGRHPDPRDQGPWPPRQPYEQPRGPYEPAPRPRQGEYPATTAPHYSGHPAYAPPAERYPPTTHAPHQSLQAPPPSQPYESPERQRHLMLDRPPPPPPPPQRARIEEPHLTRREENALPAASVAYREHEHRGPAMFDSPRNRVMEEPTGPTPQRPGFLGIQEINRKGRVSPLPQAVQGAQPQLAGPAGEPGIKSEFGRMFSGIGSGVGALSSPIPTGAQLPYSSAGLARRDEADNGPQDTPMDSAGKGPRDSGARSRRRKLKEENDDDSTGRATPSGSRSKKAKTHAHHHHHHHHHHHFHGSEQSASATPTGNTPFKNVKGTTPIPSPTNGFAKDLPNAHHHHSAPRSRPPNPKSVPAPPPTPPPVVLPKPKCVVSNKAVLDSVAERPRNHLGDVVYDPILKPARRQDPRTGRPPRLGYSSTPKPLPQGLIEDKENCTLTVKVGRQHLTKDAREEITSRRAVWGTDIYTDDSDVIAACIHAGWIRGEWPEDVDVSMLDLHEGISNFSIKDVRGGDNAIPDDEKQGNLIVLSEPPKTGPVDVPENQDLHVTLLILPLLSKYSSSTRFGIKSREFGGRLGPDGSVRRAVHDGVSFMVIGARFVTNGAAPSNRLRGKARRERIRKHLAEVERIPPFVPGPNYVPKGPQLRLLWKPTSSKASSDGDKENLPVGEKDSAAPVVEEVDVDLPAKENPPAPAEEAVQETDETVTKGGANGSPTKEAVETTEPPAEEISVDEKPAAAPVEESAA